MSLAQAEEVPQAFEPKFYIPQRLRGIVDFIGEMEQDRPGRALIMPEGKVEIAAVVELAWGFHILALGLVALAIALLSPDPLRARLGVVVTVAFALSQGLSAGTAAQFGYGGTDGMGLFAIVVIGVPLITLITCAVRWNARPVSTS